MNWLTIFLVYLLNIQNEEDLCEVQMVFFLKNNFWCIDRNQLKTDKGYLCRADINIECRNGFTVSSSCFSKSSCFLKSTNFGYIPLENSMIVNDIISFLRSPEVDLFSLRFLFLFTDRPIDNFYCFKEYKGTIQQSATYKLPEKISENRISFRCNVSTEIRIKYIKGRFNALIWLKILKFNEYIKNINEKKMEKGISGKIEYGADFNLCYFESYSECLSNLKKFIEELCYFKLLKDDSPETSKSDIDNTTTLKVSQLEERLYQKCYEKLEELFGVEINENWKPLLDNCLNFLKRKMLKNKIFFPIGGKYNIDFYIEELSNLVYKSAIESQEESTPFISEDRILNFSKKTESMIDNLKVLQSTAMDDFCEFDYIPKHFSKFLKRELGIVDYNIEIEKMVCDYYNMFAYIINLYYRFNIDSTSVYLYVPPVSSDNYNVEIIDGIKIKFNWPNQFKKIRGFDKKGKGIIMLENTDYFINEIGVLYCPSEVLEMKSIQEIELILFNYEDGKKNYRKIKINEHLSI